jgi:hypothetical protein
MKRLEAKLPFRECLQPPNSKRIEWGNAVCDAIGGYGLGRLDAQRVLYVNTALANALYYFGAKPEEAARIILEAKD